MMLIIMGYLTFGFLVVILFKIQELRRLWIVSPDLVVWSFLRTHLFWQDLGLVFLATLLWPFCLVAIALAPPKN